jgi:hypothetical protein
MDFGWPLSNGHGVENLSCRGRRRAPPHA